MNATAIPKEFDPLINEIVSLAAHDSNNLDSLDLSQFEEWLAGDGYDLLLEGWKDELVGLDLIEFARSTFRDSEIRSRTDIDDDTVIDDQLRLQYVREQIDSEFSSGDETHISSIHRLAITDQMGSTVILGYLLEQEGYGFAIHCQGVYKTEESYLEELRRSGLLLQNEKDALSVKAILALWNFKVKR